MIVAALVAMAVANVVIGLTLVASMSSHRDESDRWAKERRELLNRVIARHTGEVLALDRDQAPKADRERTAPVLVEGLS